MFLNHIITPLLISLIACMAPYKCEERIWQEFVFYYKCTQESYLCILNDYINILCILNYLRNNQIWLTFD